ncbi:DUF2785 domain-containing protein [Bacillus sp. AK128]
MNLKSRLSHLKNENLHHLRFKDLECLIDEMLDNIGAIDPELRDTLIYPTFIKIIDQGGLTKEQHQYILNHCLDDQHLLYKIGEKNTDSVFTRSFSSLVIAGLLSKDRQIGDFSHECIKNVYQKTEWYLKNEQDTRGFVEEKGWAHSIAHGADLLVSVVRHPKSTESCSLEVLNIISNCLLKDATYIDDEDERLIFVIEALIERNLDEKMLNEWIIQLLNQLEWIKEQESTSNRYYRTKFNISNFLKALYFRMGFKEIGSGVRDVINDELKVLHEKVYGPF